MARAEGDGARTGTQILGAAAAQVQNRVGNDRIPRLRRKGAGPGAALVTQQHKGSLSHRGGHVHGGVIRAAQRQSILRTGRGGLHHIAGEFAQPHGLLRQPGCALGIAPGLAAEIKGRLAVLQGAQRRGEQPAGGLVRRHQQTPPLQQRVQRRLRKAHFPDGIHSVPETGAQLLDPFVAVGIGHFLRGGADLHADGVLAVPFQQTQAGAAFRLGAAQLGGNIPRWQAKDAQDFQLSWEHVVTSRLTHYQKT